MLKLENVVKVYGEGDNAVSALKGVSLEFRKSEFVAILGSSGCGKTTLLNIIGGLDRYTSGDLFVAGKSTKNFKDGEWDAYRNNSIGFVFQSYNLISHQSILANVEMALTLAGISAKERKRRAISALEKVGLGDKIKKRPNQLSGGQMQRVAIARAIINDPEIILADEPTGALDSETSVQVMEILKEISKDRLVIMVTHNGELADTYATRIVRLHDGEVVSDSRPLDDKEREELEIACEKSFGTVIRLADRIEQLPEAAACDKIAVFGSLADSEPIAVYFPPNMTGITDGYILRRQDTSMGENVPQAMLRDYCGLSYGDTTQADKDRIAQTAQYQEMPCWPKAGSVAAFDHILVIKFSEENDS